jgi:hypothetical protein
VDCRGTLDLSINPRGVCPCWPREAGTKSNPGILLADLDHLLLAADYAHFECFDFQLTGPFDMLKESSVMSYTKS